MEDVVISGMVWLFRGICFLWDIVAFIPYNLLYSPDRRVKQSHRVKARSVTGQPDGPYRTVDHFNGLSTSLFPECQTLDDLFLRAVEHHGPRPALGTRQLLSEEDELQPNGKVFKKVILGEYQWQTFREVSSRADHVGAGLAALGQLPRQHVCVFAETRAEWMVVAQSCLRYNYPVVTLYATLGEEAIVHGVNESEVSLVITSCDLLPKFKNILGRLSRVRHLVYMEGARRPDLAGFPDHVTVTSLGDVERRGAQNEGAVPTKPAREDLAVIMYTSGSTGLPKGVLITHGNLMCGISGQCQRIPDLGSSDTYIGYLPLAHVLELSAELACLSNGVRIGYSSPLTLSDQSSKIKRGSRGDASELQPTLMAAVPVIMDRLYKTVWEKVNEGGIVSKAVFRFVYEHKKRRLVKGYDTPVHNRVVFNKISRILGGKLRMMLSASDLSTGRVGAPLQCNEIRLRDWTEGGYTVSDRPFPRGEILIGGGNVTMGYYKNPEKTKEDFCVIDGVRYFCTGDIGQLEADGCLRITDRKKDLVKLQAGEYVSLSKVETALKMCPLVDNCCLYADSMQHYTVCLLVPNQKQLLALGEKLGIPGEWEELCKQEDVVAEYMKAVNDVSKKAGLERFEVPQRVTLCTELWTPESGLVTDAFKLKRKNIQTHYQKDITRMYA